LALSFLLHNLSIIRVGEGWFSDAMCVLADIVFFFVPEYLLGPRLVSAKFFCSFQRIFGFGNLRVA